MEYIRPSQETRRAVIISDPHPVEAVADLWAAASHAATIGIFLLAFAGVLYLGRAFLMPILAAAVVVMTLAPLIKAAKRRGISPWITALIIVLCGLGAVTIAVTFISGPISEWVARAPEIGGTIKERLSVLDRPLASLRQLETTLFGGNAAAGAAATPAPNVVMPVVAFVTPAVGELLIFFGTLMFGLVGQFELRTRLVSLFTDRDAKLRVLKIINDIEKNLAGYLVVVTMINVALGIVVGIGAWLIGFPSPAIVGLLAAVLNYIPYVGPAVMIVVLFVVGLMSFPSLGHALIAPLGFVALTTLEGHFITPTIVGRRITLNPLLIFLALAFWTWMWGPIGAFLAAPLSIIGLVVMHHLFPSDETKFPD